MRVDEHTTELTSSFVFYRSAPATGITPVLLHGIPGSSEDWTALLELAGGIAPDLLGFGRSGKGGHLDYSIRGLATSVEELLAGLGADRVQLVGHDFGAAVALELARRAPERVARLALCNPVPLVEGFKWPRAARLLRRPGLGELLMGATSRWLLGRTLRSASAKPRAWPEERVARVWEQFDQGTQRAVLRLLRCVDGGAGEGGANEFDGAAEAGRPDGSLAMPTLVIWGERDPWYPVSLAPVYGAAFAHATVEPVPDAGHWPWLDRPELVGRIAAFLGQPL